MKVHCLSIVALVSLSGILHAQQPLRPVAAVDQVIEANALHLKTGKIELDSAGSLHAIAANPAPVAGYHVLQLDGPLTPERLATLADAGVALGQYLPANAYIVHLPAGFDAGAKLGHIGFVRWVGVFDKSWKLDPEIGTQIFETPERVELAHKGILKLAVALFEGENLDAGAAAIAAVPGVKLLSKDLSGEMGMIEITVPQANYTALADIPAVQWVEEAGEATLRNDTNRWILQSYIANVPSVWNRGLNGSGEVGGHIDSGVLQTHCSFNESGKIVAYFGSTSSSSHGTHTAGTFLGDERPANGLGFRGMAYKARMAFTNLSSVSSTNLFSVLMQNRNAGGRVHSNSWGNDGTTAYNSWARDIDVFSFNNEDDLVLFAVTNQSGTIRNPENAKNCLAVAACTDNPAQNHCSGGTASTNDGRRKPEVMAPGCSTISSQNNTSCGFVGAGFTGTSMACPAVAGSGLLVRQYYREGFYPSGLASSPDGFVPSGALIKATLINSAVDMTGIGGFPSNQEGWGRVLLENALYFSGDTRKLLVLDDRRNASGLTSGGERDYTISVGSSLEPLKVTLVWTEKEAALNANPAYINNLNLEVSAPGGALYRGNVFSGGVSATGGTADFRNNVEQVLLNSPGVGRYTIRVLAPTVNTTTPQGFALIVTGAVQRVATPQIRQLDAQPVP